MYDETKLALQMVCPSNDLVADDRGIPSIFVPIVPTAVKDLLESSEDSTVHPAFLFNSVQDPKVLIGKYEGYRHNDRLASLPGVDPTTVINFDQALTACRNKGPGHHLVTAAEWAFLALWCKKNGTQPKGNTNWGKDSSESIYVAIPTTFETAEGVNKGKAAHIATGTGPDSWYHDGTKAGIADLCGNVWEWVAGLRLVKGELQVIPGNNAADSSCDMSVNSKQWKAINYAATDWNNIFIDPNGQGTTASSIKLDMKESKWVWQKETIADAKDESRSALFADITFGADVTDFCKNYLRIMALAPDETTTDYNGDRVWANNKADERLASRGGRWTDGTHAGVFSLALSSPRTNASTDVGARCAFRENK